MANVKLFDQTGKEVAEVVLNDAIWYWTKRISCSLMLSSANVLAHKVVWTHAVKTVLAVSGGADANHGVKGTDVPPAGFLYPPHDGGGVVFGPTRSCLQTST